MTALQHVRSDGQPGASVDKEKTSSQYESSIDAEATTLGVELSPAETLPQEHREYLLHRHGTLDLEPLPSADPAEPYNWPAWKKMANLIVVGFHAMMTTFTAAAIIPVYEDIANDFSISIRRTSYLTSLQILVLGWAPLFWKPLSQRYGRRPIWLVSMIGSLLFNVGCALSRSFAAMATCRALVSFFLCPALAYGSGVVAETYFKKERAKFMGVWTLLVTLGPPMGPFIMGFVGYHTGNYRSVYWVLAVVNGFQFIAYRFLGPETRYIHTSSPRTLSTFRKEYLSFRRIDSTPLTLSEFFYPLTLIRHASVTIPSIAYSIVFGFTSVLLTVEIPQLFLPKFHFNAQQIGLQFLGIIIGSIIGEQLGGRTSDWWMNRRRRITSTSPQAASAAVRPEHRLTLTYPALLLAILGLLIFGVQLAHIPTDGDWNVTPIIGIAIAAGGNQLLTTVLVTYAVDCHASKAGDVGIFVNVVRQTWGFIGPIWFPDMLEGLGVVGSVSLCSGVIVLLGVLPVGGLQWWRMRQGERTSGKCA